MSPLAAQRVRIQYHASMQQLTKVSIYNFRSCKEISDLKLSVFTPLVGYNNAGKSNILAAIQWVLQKSTLGEADFFDPKKPVRVDASISGVTDEVLAGVGENHRTKIEKYVRDGCIVIQREQDTPEAKAAGVKLNIFDHDGEGDGAWVRNPSGIDNAIKALFPDPIQIGAMEDAGKDIGKFESGSTIGKLISKLMSDVKDAQGHQIADQLELLRGMLDSDGEERASELTQFDEAANGFVKDFFPGVSVKVHIPAPEIKTVFKTGTIRVYEKHGAGKPVGRDVSSMGHGAQRAIQMALVRQLAEADGGGATGRTLLLVDEPELYMHPQAISKVRTALRILAQSSYQVVFTTHSPLMIGREDLADTIVVCKANDTGSTPRKPLGAAMTTLEVKARPQLDELFSLDGACQVLFSDRVVVCEGKTERELLPDIFESHHGVPPADKRVGVVPVRGSGNVAKSLLVLNEMDISAGAIVDLDYAFKEAVKASLLDAGDENLKACKELLKNIVEEKEGAELDVDGCVKAMPGSDRSVVAECYAALGRHDKANGAIENIAEALRKKGVWLWSKGTIETHLGMTEKNAKAWSEMRVQLRKDGIDMCSDAKGVMQCAEWMGVIDEKEAR